MKKTKIITTLILFAVFLILTSGCTATHSTEETDSIITETSVPQAQISPVIVKENNIPDEITITTDSKPVNKNSALLISYTLDSEKTNYYANQDGWKIIVTAFAYNTEKVPADFSPKTIDEIMESGIPYQSRSIHVYPNKDYTDYNDKIEISDSPSGEVIDTNKPYNYGILFRLQ